MAYISTEQVKKIREEIKQKFPSKENWKFSISREHFSGVRLHVLQAPVNFEHKKGCSILPNRETHPYLQQIYNIANSGNHDNSDAMTDYFDVGWYVWMHIGSYDKEFVFKP